VIIVLRLTTGRLGKWCHKHPAQTFYSLPTSRFTSGILDNICCRRQLKYWTVRKNGCHKVTLHRVGGTHAPVPHSWHPLPLDWQIWLSVMALPVGSRAEPKLPWLKLMLANEKPSDAGWPYCCKMQRHRWLLSLLAGTCDKEAPKGEFFEPSLLLRISTLYLRRRCCITVGQWMQAVCGNRDLSNATGLIMSQLPCGHMQLAQPLQSWKDNCHS